jgi:hypothetical protein
MRRRVEATPAAARLRGSALRALLSLTVLCCGVLAFGSASAFGEYSLAGSFGEPGSGAGQFEVASRTAVEASTGDVFVNAGVDTNTVETVKLSGVTDGTFRLGFASEFEGRSTGGEGEGTVKESSAEITGVVEAEAKFAEGEEISGEGIAPSTLIASISSETVTLAKPAEGGVGTKAHVSLKADLPFNATARAVHNALDVLLADAAASGEAAVFGEVAGGPRTIEFRGGLSEKVIETMTCGSGFAALNGTCSVTNTPAKNTRRVEKWKDVGGTYREVGTITASGAPEPFQTTEREPGVAVGGVAVDNDPASGFTGDAYVAVGEYVDQLKPEASEPNKYEYVAQFKVGGDIRGLAVNPKNGDVYATSGTTFVEYEPDGTLVVEQRNVGGPPGSAAEGLAVNGDSVYMIKDKSNEEGEEFDTLVRYKQSPTVPHELEEEAAITEVSGLAGFRAVTLDPATGDVFLLSSKAAAFHVEVFTESGTPIEEFGTGQIGESRGLAYSPFNGDVYVSDLTSSNVHVFGVKVALPEHKLVVEDSTEGNVVGSEAATGINCGTGVGCEAEIEETEAVTLTATGKAGFAFEEWTEGPCVGAKAKENPCKFAMPSADTQVAAKYAASTKHPLAVRVTGKGEVNDGKVIVKCTSSGGTCTEEAEGKVILTATAPTGSVFAGWIGECQKEAPTECEVAVTAATTVTAVFLQEGVQGKNGEGVIIEVLAPGEHGCAAGGIAVKAGTAGTPTYVCAGKEGEVGVEGIEGLPGPEGKAGALGERGAAGASGVAGSAGAQGPPGPAGPAGKEGPAGRVELVTCKKIGNRQKCTTKLVSGTVNFAATGSSARATLSRHGAVYAAGTARSVHGRMRLRLLTVRGLSAGRYTLTLISGSGRHERTRSEAFTLR